MGPELRVRRLETLWERTRGLLGQPPPEPGEAVWIIPCRQVHTFGMRYPIDVVHLDGDGAVLGVQTLKPWRLGAFRLEGKSILELRQGEAARLGLSPGIIPRLLPLQGPC